MANDEDDRSGRAADHEKRVVALSSVIAAVFLTGIKLLVGLLTGSLGILSEAAHSALDLVATIHPERCSACRTCNNLCPFNPIEYNEAEGVTYINAALSKGCGTRVAACPSGAITGAHFSNEQIFAELGGLLFDADGAGVKAPVAEPVAA